jgi:hypothetical protein
MTMKAVILLLGLILVILIAGVAFSPYTLWEVLVSPVMGLPEIRQLSQVKSPDGQFAVTAVSISQGGATVGFKYELLLSKRGDQNPIKTRRTIWRSYRVSPLRIVWQGERIVSVVVSTSDSDYFWSIRTTKNGPIACTTVDEQGAVVTVRP